jgi:DNA polymerase-3 subunit delta
VLVTGTEALLADRAIQRVLDALREKSPELEVIDIDAAVYEAGQLGPHTSPSLFGEPRLVRVSGVEACSDPFVTDVLGYLDDVQDDVTLVLRHGGGQKGKKLLDGVRKSKKSVVVDCAPLKKEPDKIEFLHGEFRAADRRATPGAIRALVAAVGSDLRELASAASQLMSDSSGEITEQDVERYYGGRVEATGFKVADAVAAGRGKEALALLRQAVDTGVDPVPLVAVVALKLRTMARVAGTRGRSPDVARELGMARWQVERARKDLVGWTPDGIKTGLIALAEADAAVKGGGRDPVYAVEKAVVAITGARAGDR